MKTGLEELLAFHSRLASSPECGDAGRLAPDTLRRKLAALGISRVGDITDLDCIGVPVWFACRPASRSLSVSQGKALAAEQAWISAVMESAEAALAERPAALIAAVATQRELSRRGFKLVDLGRQSRCAANRIGRDQELAWVEGVCWTSGEPVYAPYELVGMDMTAHSPWDRYAFRMSSLGLGAGASLGAAIRHGVQELLEEDAFFAISLPVVAAAETRSMKFRIAAQHGLHELRHRVAKAGLQLRFFEISSACETHTVLAMLEPDGWRGGIGRQFSGYACRSSLADAALAAGLEAIQSRLTFIAGARDDLWVKDYEPTRANLKSLTELVIESGPDSAAEPAAECGLDAQMRLAGAIGGGDTYVFPLGGQDCGIRAVRVLADDLASTAVPVAAPYEGRAARRIIERFLAA